MKKLLMMALLFLGTNAFAQMESAVLGAWQGQLEYTDAEGTAATCSATNTFTVADDKLLMTQELGGDCDWQGQAEFDLQGQEIWQDGVKIGEITADAIAVKDYKIDEDSVFSFTITVDSENAAHAVYSDHTDYGEGYWDSLQGELTKRETPGPLL